MKGNFNKRQGREESRGGRGSEEVGGRGAEFVDTKAECYSVQNY